MSPARQGTSLMGSIFMSKMLVFDDLALEESTSHEHVCRKYLPLVQSLARRMHRRLPQHVEFDDLVSAGMLGLVEASAKFDAAKNVDFGSYAYRRIHGAIVDSLRDLDWAPRGLRRRSREVQEAIRVLSVRLRRNPSEEEIAAELGIPLAQYQYLVGELASLEIESLHRKAHEDSDEDEDRCLPDSQENSPLDACLRGELDARMLRAIEQLPRLEKTVVRLYFNEGRTRTEIAELLGMTVVEVGRIRSSAILTLRAAVNGATPRGHRAPIRFHRSRTKLFRDVQTSPKAA